MAGFRRFFVPVTANQITIDGEEFRHAVSVLRIKEGEKVIVCDNSGWESTAVIKSINKKDLIAEIIDKKLSETEAKTRVVLIAGYLKGDKTELIVQKAVELGVCKIVVFSSEFSSAYMNENKLSRLNKVSIESAKQCGRAVAPTVVYADCFEEALKQGNECENKLFACEFATQNEADLNALTGSCAIVVGSEGGFSQEESNLAFKEGYKTVFLISYLFSFSIS